MTIGKMRFKIALIPEKRIEFLKEMEVLSIKQLAQNWGYDYIYLSRILSGDRHVPNKIWNKLTNKTTRIYYFFEVLSI